MSSSSDFEDVPPISKSSDTSLPKKEASSQYLTMLNSNTKFNEMLKNKIKQTGVSPLLNTHDFNPVASSTQIGTPDELKRKSIKKQSDVKTSPKKKGLSSSVVVKREPVSFESGDENITKQPKLKKKKADLQMESKRRKEEAQTVSRLTSTTQSKKSGAANESESSVDSESDSHSSVPPSPRTKHSKESTGSLNRSRKQSSSESSEDEGRPTIMSKEPVYGQSNSKINFSKFNNKTKSTISNSDSEPESLRPSLPVKRELHSDVEHVSKKKKHKVTPKPSSSGSSEDQDHVSARQKNQKNKQKVPPKTSSSSSSEGEDDVPVRASSSGTRRESMTRSSSDSPSQKNVSKASNRKKNQTREACCGRGEWRQIF
uniref:Uncharacterized protein n=1 Tax=Photinus pyralis TaxID=7054 RepID=A0A1Y1L5N5_PHOPY